MARSCVEIAEETADTLAPWFGYDFAGKRIVLDLHDESDESNGAARIRQRYVRIDLRKTRFLWRGETQWLRNVIAHELSHTYTLDVIKPPVYVSADANVAVEGWDGSSSLFIERQYPEWLVEGLAQLGAYRLAADRRDPYREMLLRDAYISGKLLSLSDMARFERTSRERELVYNQGFAFLLFLMQTHPDAGMTRFLKTVRTAGLERAARIAFGSGLEALHRGWVASLADRYGGASAAKASAPALQALYPQKNYPFTVEASATADGRYVIANWGEDFESYSLYERRNGNLRLIKKDTGTVLKKDPASGTVWFNALVYDQREHEAQYELFVIDHSGRPAQVLEGTRCLAFDASDGRVVFASYRDGVTRLEQYDSNAAKRSVLRELPAGISVYDIAVLESGEILATIGDGTRIRLFRSGPGGAEEVWPGVAADITSPVSLGGSRIAFASTLDGTPQLYAAALGAPQWQRLTDVSGGVTGPTAWDAESGSLVCGVYEAGSLRAEKLVVAGSTGAAVAPFPGSDAQSAAAPRDPLVTGPLRERRIGESLGVTSRGGTLVPSIPTWIVGYGIEDNSVAGVGQTEIHSVWAGADVLFTGSSGLLELEIQARADAYLEQGFVSSLHPYLGLFLDLELPVGTLSQTFETYGYSNFVYEDPTQYVVHNWTVLRTITRYSLPLTLHLSTMVGYSYSHQLFWETYHAKEGYVYAGGIRSFETASGPLYGRHDLTSGIQLSDEQQTYDPARLGNAGSTLRLQADGILVSYYDRNLLGVAASDDPSTGLLLDAYARATALLAGRKASITARLRGIGYVVPTEIPNDPPPYFYASLGRQGLATGYDYFSPVDAFVQGELELRFNPFYDPFDAVRWYERFSLGLRVEGGVAWLIDQGSLDAGYPLTLEAGLRGGFLITPQREASFYFLVAVPMYDKGFFGTESDYRVYFGASF